MNEPRVKAIGELMRCTLVEVDGLDDFFNRAKEEEWILEDIIDEWAHKDDKLLLLPAKQFKSQFTLIQDNLPQPIFFKNSEVEEEFYFLQQDEVLEISGIKNASELSGEGKIITSFDLKFNDFKKRYLRIPDSCFFDIEDDQIILNQVRLIQDNNNPTLGLKLTGKAAKIAARKKMNV